MNSAHEVRNFIVDFLKREIVGPAPGFPAIQINGEEILRPQDPPRHRYGAGILFPQKAVRSGLDAASEEVESGEETDDSDDAAEKEIEGAGEDESSASQDDVSDTDQEANLANEFLPSAMGLSALIKLPNKLKVRVTAAIYEHSELPGWERKDKTGRIETQKGWWRLPISDEITFTADELKGEGILIVNKIVHHGDHPTDLRVHVVSRPFLSAGEGVRLITITLINQNISSQASPRNEDCFYQCGFLIESDGEDSPFLEYPDRPEGELAKEERSLKLLYRHRKVYAVGHGCSADWLESSLGSAARVWTEVLPAFEIKPVLPEVVPGLDLSMLALAEGARETSLLLCTSLADHYATWIAKNREVAQSDPALSPIMREVAETHLKNCELCLTRIRVGIEELRHNDAMWSAFALMNRSMLEQQIHYRISSNSDERRSWKFENAQLSPERPYVPPSHSDPSRKWYPFQLAFVLMNIQGLSDPASDDRKVVDLIWFPTGGGKTEAYLGLSALTFFYRRLTDRTNGGTAVLMRYTLRLLTTQQFQRAASLICACELIRRERTSELGDEPFTIGLWVGSDVTPNTDDQARNVLNEVLRGQGDNKFVVLACPWCGIEMGPVEAGGKIKTPGYEFIGSPKTFRFQCPDPGCEFHSEPGLPMTVIDQQIYHRPPTLLIGTVDKFAMLPWNSPSRRIFGIDVPSVTPPDLIIQDELHLISGPLGSMVGHYETVIDELCVRTDDGERYPAKIVASTATISRAEEQIRSLYAREAFLFPPQGLRAGDSFFAREREDRVGRKYLGVLASALPSHVTAQVRVMSALLQSVKCAPGAGAAEIDPYWTMMGYFNSMRELGHAATLIRADIREYLNAVWDRMGLTADIGGNAAKALRRFINRDVELTGRVQSSQIPGILNELFDQYKGLTPTDAVDVCFATNMIQVGLDVPRLSLMTVIGQPKTTSEYIQASSRVGRQQEKPGLVVTNYNPFKPRDRSHFEHFRAYHESIYRFVEPTSVTPFSVPVRERALHALLVTLTRFWGASTVQQSPRPAPDDVLLKRVIDVLERRVGNISPDEAEDTHAHIEDLLSFWERLEPSKYGGFDQTDAEMPLMHPAGAPLNSSWHVEPWSTPTSMRNVDASCEAYQIGLYPTI